MTTSDPHATATRHTDTASRIIDGEAVILRPMDNAILTLNETGTRIWELLAESPAVDRIIRIVCDEFDVEEEAAATDVTAFLEEMERKGLVHIGPPANAGRP